MPSVAQVISDLRQDLNSVTYDGHISAKYLHSKLVDTARLFIKREADDRRLYLYPNIWVTIDNFQLKEANLIGCANIQVPNCNKIMKSVLELPEIYTTRYGYLINISSVDYTNNYIQTTPRDYNKIKNRKFQNPNLRYFWIYNNRLVIPDCLIEGVTIKAMFCDKAKGLRIEGCRDPECIKTLEQEFVAPGHLLDDIKKATFMGIAGGRERIQPDSFPNLNELEKKGPTTK